MDIECPHCNIEQKLDDIAHSLKNGHYKCPVCGGKIPSPFAEQHEIALPFRLIKYLILLIFILVGIATVFAIHYFSKPIDKVTPQTTTLSPVMTPSVSISPPVPAVNSDVSSNAPKVQTTLPQGEAPGKMQIVEQIASNYHTSHSYTMEGGFVCLDMAIDVWNQLRTYGIEAKIMGGNIDENITTWTYRQLAMKSNHAWVVAKLSATEKVAIETTAGKVIKPEVENASIYFKGIEFDTPAQIKRFEFLRKIAYAACQDLDQSIKDWNENVAGKQQYSEETIIKRSRLEQQKQGCENTFKALKEFESKAIFY